MCKLTLNAVVTKALVDERFREALLTGRSEAALREFPLGEEERRALASIHAEDLQGFVTQVHRLMGEEPSPWWYGVKTSVPSSAVAYAMAGD